MNNKGQISTLGISFMIGIVIFLIGFSYLNFIKDEVTRARSTDSLDCNDSSISDGSKLTCLIVDVVVPYFIIIILSASGGYITSRLLT